MLTSDTLFSVSSPVSPRCRQCFDTGLWMTFAGNIEACPRSLFDARHPAPNAAAAMLGVVARRLAHKPNAMEFDLARILTHFTSDCPCPTVKLLDYFFSDTNLGHAQRLRVVAFTIEELRSKWTLPVGGRKSRPSGYWIITDLEDCKEWLRRASSAPRTQLVNIWRAARAAFPILAGQREFDFMNGIEASDAGEVADVY